MDLFCVKSEHSPAVSNQSSISGPISLEVTQVLPVMFPAIHLDRELVVFVRECDIKTKPATGNSSGVFPD